MQETLMSEGVDLLITGMGTVVIFLAVLVVLTTIMSHLIMRYLPDPVIEIPSKIKPIHSSQPVDPLTLQILQQGVNAHRSRLNQK